MKLETILFVAFILLLQACASVTPTSTSNMMPKAPDYTNLVYWAAHPDKKDNADRVPNATLKNEQETADVDVFFLHPTTYTGDKGQNQWNGPVTDPRLNERTDDGTILFQASVFNGIGKIYAPRYRQAHLHSYFATDKERSKKAFELAYKDIETAFNFYMENHNNGRPFIIAAHSQGTTHAKSLIKNLIDGKALQKQFVVAYLVGMPVAQDYFSAIKPCETPQETNCFCSWRTWQKGYYPDAFQENNNIAVTNPILWTIENTYADKELNEGTILRKFDKGFRKQLIDAQVHDGLLWISKPKFFGSFLFNWKNYHIADYNLFYANIRKNAKKRVTNYLEKKEN